MTESEIIKKSIEEGKNIEEEKNEIYEILFSDDMNFAIRKKYENRTELFVCNFDNNQFYIKNEKTGKIYANENLKEGRLNTFFKDCNNFDISCKWFNYKNDIFTKKYLGLFLSNDFYRSLIKYGFTYLDLLNSKCDGLIFLKSRYILSKLSQLYRNLKFNYIDKEEDFNIYIDLYKNNSYVLDRIIQYTGNENMKINYNNILYVLKNYYKEINLLRRVLPISYFLSLLKRINEIPENELKNVCQEIINVNLKCSLINFYDNPSGANDWYKKINAPVETVIEVLNELNNNNHVTYNNEITYKEFKTEYEELIILEENRKNNKDNYKYIKTESEIYLFKNNNIVLKGTGYSCNIYDTKKETIQYIKENIDTSQWKISRSPCIDF